MSSLVSEPKCSLYAEGCVTESGGDRRVVMASSEPMEHMT